MIDFMTGVVAALGCVSALLARATQGGRDVDVSLFDVALHQLTYPGTWYLNHGIETGRVARSAHPLQHTSAALQNPRMAGYLSCV